MNAGATKTLILLAPGLVAWASVAWAAKWYWLNQPDLAFGWIVLVLCLMLFRDQVLLPRPYVGRWSAFSLTSLCCGVAALLLFRVLQASLGTTPFSLHVGLLGATLFLWANADYILGRRAAMAIAFAAAYLFLALPLPSILYSPVVSTLQAGVTRTASELLTLIGVPVVRYGNVIDIVGTRLQVNDACSGVRSLQSTLMMALFLGHLTLRSNWTRACVLGIGVLVAAAFNSLRIVVVGMYSMRHPGQPIERFHDLIGWIELGLVFSAMAAFIYAASRLERHCAPILTSNSSQGVPPEQPSTQPSPSVLPHP